MDKHWVTRIPTYSPLSLRTKVYSLIASKFLKVKSKAIIKKRTGLERIIRAKKGA